MRVLALDFDGVISDSAAESFTTALRTYAALRPASQTADLARALVDAPSDVLQGDARYRAFVDLMPLGNRAEDFAVVLGVIESGAAVADQAGYDAARAAEDPAFLEAFHARFYVERATLRDADPDAWTRRVAPYGPFLSVLRRRAKDVALWIATAKDRSSVDLLLAAYGIGDLFGAERILDKELGTSKRAHLCALRERQGVEFAEITFVDDKVNHLDDVAGLGVRGALAAWGYNGAREQALARRAGHLVCELTTVEAMLFGE